MKHICRPQTTYNIECTLFDLCNLHCTFCYESICGKRANNFSRDYIKKFPEIFKQYHLPNIKESNKKDVLIAVCGGELFLDSFPDDLFEDYADFAIKINCYLKNEIPDARLNISWLSNYTFTEWDRVEQLLDYTNTNIATSYDAVGRFHSPDLLGKWLMTFNHFKDRTTMATVTLHKDNIKAIIEGDRGFEILMENPQIWTDISYYVPINNIFEKFIPTDYELFDFYKFALDNRYFSINVISDFMKTVLDIDSVESYCHCDSAILTDRSPDDTEILSGGCVDIIENLMQDKNDKKSFYGDNYDIMNDDDNKHIAGRIRRGCMNCEWYQNCQKMCFSAIMYKNFKPKFCPIEKAYKYIQKDIQIAEDYLKFNPKRNEVRYVR